MFKTAKQPVAEHALPVLLCLISVLPDDSSSDGLYPCHHGGRRAPLQACPAMSCHDPLDASALLPLRKPPSYNLTYMWLSRCMPRLSACCRKKRSHCRLPVHPAGSSNPAGAEQAGWAGLGLQQHQGQCLPVQAWSAIKCAACPAHLAAGVRRQVAGVCGSLVSPTSAKAHSPGGQIIMSRRRALPAAVRKMPYMWSNLADKEGRDRAGGHRAGCSFCTAG